MNHKGTEDTEERKEKRLGEGRTGQ